MTMLIWDVETRSECDLKHEGSFKYAQHPSTTVLCIAYAVDDGPIKLWKPGDGVPPEFVEAARNKDWTSVAHNHQFETLILNYVLKGWPKIPVERTVCTMANAHAMALPGSLEKVAEVCNMRYQKDKVGHRIMLQVTQPRKPRKDEDPNGVYWHDDPVKLGILYKYCKLDVAATREIAYALPWLSDEEQKVWLLDQKINRQGLYLDEKLLDASENIIVEAHAYILGELTKLTNGQVTTPTQRARILKWLQQFIPALEDLRAPTIADLLDNEKLPEHVRKMLELRQLGAAAAPKKIKALLNRREPDGRVRGAFVYHAAGTGRWSSRGAQVHNMKRSQTEDIEAAIKVIQQGSFKKAAAVYDQPLSVIGDLVRATVSAPKGYVLMGADFSGIEARVSAWLANEARKLEAFRLYDAGLGPDPYIVAAAAIFSVDANDLAKRYKAGDVKAKEMRQAGKAAELAFGFGGGVNAYRRFTPSGGKALTASQSQWAQGGRSGGGPRGLSGDQVKNQIADDGLTDEDIEKIKNAWRGAHPNIVKLWGAMKDATWGVLLRGHEQQCGKLTFYNDRASNFVGMILPSGRHLAYPDMRIITGFKHEETGQIIECTHVTRIVNGVETKVPARRMIVMKDNSGNWWRDVSWWYGITMENAVQAIARDLLSEAMVRIDKAGLTIVGHVHDECIIEVKACDAEKTKAKFEALMTALPSWATGMPVVAHAWTAERYVK